MSQPCSPAQSRVVQSMSCTSPACSMGSASDGSWEVQLFNCGVYASAVAARFGKSIIEVFVDQGGRLRYYLNGAEVPSLPAEGAHGVRLDSTHRSIHTEYHNVRAAAHFPGTC